MGAKGYVDEAASPAEFAQAIRLVSQGSVWGRAECFRCLSSGCRRRRKIFSRRRVTLTDREKRSAGDAGGGTLQQEIGAQLGIEERTVKASRSQVYAQSGGAEPDCTFRCMRFTAFAGGGEVEGST